MYSFEVYYSTVTCSKAYWTKSPRFLKSSCYTIAIIDRSIMSEGLCSGLMATTYMMVERGDVCILNDILFIHVAGSNVVSKQMYSE